MKRTVLVLAGVLLMAAAKPASAQESVATDTPYAPGPYTHLNIAKAVSNFDMGLKSGNDGVLESTLSHIVWLRLVRPDAQLCQLQEEVANLVSRGRTPAIRYRAALAAMVLDCPSSFTGVSSVSYESANELFAKVSDTAKQTVIGYNR